LKFLEKAKSQGKLDEVLNKFKKIYVTPAAYAKVSKWKVDISNIEQQSLDEKGEKYKAEVNDDILALAMQLKAKILLTEDLARVMKANEKGLKTLSVEEAIK